MFAENWVFGLSDTEVAAGWIGGNHAEGDAVRGIFLERNEERGFERGSLSAVEQLKSLDHYIANHQLAVDVDLPGVPVPVWANQRPG